MQLAKQMSVLVLMTASLSVAVAAESVATVGDLSKIQAETLILRARAKQAEARAELASRSQQTPGVAEDTTLPVVKSIFGTDKQVVATFLYPNSVRVAAKVGDMLPGGYDVAAIDSESNKVVISRGKERHVIGFSSVAPVSKDARAPQQPRFPGPMPIVPSPAGIPVPGASF